MTVFPLCSTCRSRSPKGSVFAREIEVFERHKHLDFSDQDVVELAGTQIKLRTGATLSWDCHKQRVRSKAPGAKSVTLEHTFAGRCESDRGGVADKTAVNVTSGDRYRAYRSIAFLRNSAALETIRAYWKREYTGNCVFIRNDDAVQVIQPDGSFTLRKGPLAPPEAFPTPCPTACPHVVVHVDARGSADAFYEDQHGGVLPGAVTVTHDAQGNFVTPHGIMRPFVTSRMLVSAKN